MILVGSYDPATPPRWGRLVAETLSRSYVYEFPGMGHTLFWDGSCAQEIAAAFFRDPERAPEDCASLVVGPPFVTPQEVAVTPGVYRLSQTLGQSPTPLPLAALAVFVVSWLVQATLLVTLLVRWPRASRTARWQYGVTGLIGVLNLACVVAVALLIRTALVAEPLTLGFGLPAEARPWFVLPVLAALITVGMLLYSGITWRQQGWTRWRRAYVLACGLVAVGFIGWLQAWDLLLV